MARQRLVGPQTRSCSAGQGVQAFGPSLRIIALVDLVFSSLTPAPYLYLSLGSLSPIAHLPGMPQWQSATPNLSPSNTAWPPHNLHISSPPSIFSLCSSFLLLLGLGASTAEDPSRMNEVSGPTCALRGGSLRGSYCVVGVWAVELGMRATGKTVYHLAQGNGLYRRYLEEAQNSAFVVAVHPRDCRSWVVRHPKHSSDLSPCSFVIYHRRVVGADLREAVLRAQKRSDRRDNRTESDCSCTGRVRRCVSNSTPQRDCEGAASRSWDRRALSRQ